MENEYPQFGLKKKSSRGVKTTTGVSDVLHPKLEMYWLKYEREPLIQWLKKDPTKDGVILRIFGSILE